MTTCVEMMTKCVKMMTKYVIQKVFFFAIIPQQGLEQFSLEI